MALFHYFQVFLLLVGDNSEGPLSVAYHHG
jgi:hypothetical protein